MKKLSLVLMLVLGVISPAQAFTKGEQSVIGAMEIMRTGIACPQLRLDPKELVDFFEMVRKSAKISKERAAALAPHVDKVQKEAMKDPNFCETQRLNLIDAGLLKDTAK